jgi:DNA repair exonuclease SbcCD nuclease subunit
VGRIAKDRGARAVLDGGDYFHVKAASRNPHALVRRTAELHRTHYNCPVYCIEGNHDITANNLDSLDRQPLGVLYETGVFGHLREEVFEDGPLRVRVVGVPYDPTLTLERLRSIRKQPGDTHLVVVAHALAAEKPPPDVEDFFGEPVFRYADLVQADGPDVFAFGHWHKDQGIVTIGGTHFVNQGALSRGALVRENLTRVPQVSILDFDLSGLSVTAIPLNVAPAEEVFDLERKARQEDKRRDIEQFVLQLVSGARVDPSLDVEANVRALGGDFARAVQDRALAYLERAGVG